MNCIIKKSTALLLAIILVLPMHGFAQVLPYMPPVGQLMPVKGEVYDLPYIVGMRFSTDNIFEFTFILNKGNLPPKESVIRPEIERIGKYFLAALTIPEKDIWVNLSPYEANRITPQALGQTDLGKDMLGEDYVLKQLAASLTHPDTEPGKAYWVGNKGANNFQKVWIVPNQIKVMEADDRAVITEASLKVLTDVDYLAMNKFGVGAALASAQNSRAQASSAPTANIDAFRKNIIPLIEQRVNTSKDFAHLRQIYHSIIMAEWFKKKLKDTILNKKYFNQNKIKGANVNDPAIREKIYNAYVEAFKKGVYNMVKTERATSNKIIKRTYFCGGVADMATGAETAVTGAQAATRTQVETEMQRAAPQGIEADMLQVLATPQGVEVAPDNRRFGGMTTEEKVAFNKPLDSLDRVIISNMKKHIAAVWQGADLSRITDGELKAAGVKDIKGFRDNLNLVRAQFPNGLPQDIVDAIFAGHCLGFANGARLKDSAIAREEDKDFADKRFARDDFAGTPEQRAQKLLPVGLAAARLAVQAYPNDKNAQKMLRDALIAIGQWAGMVGLMGGSDNSDNGLKGGMDFSAADNIEITAQNGGIKLSGKKAWEYLEGQEITGATLITKAIRV